MLKVGYIYAFREFRPHGRQDVDDAVASGLALGVAVAVDLGLDGGQGDAHALAAFELDSAGLE